MLIGVVSVAVGRTDDSILLGLFDDALHVLDVLDGHGHELLRQTSERSSERRFDRKEPPPQSSYLSVLQVPVDVLDQLPHGLLQAPEQLLLSVEYFVPHLSKGQPDASKRSLLE